MAGFNTFLPNIASVSQRRDQMYHQKLEEAKCWSMTLVSKGQRKHQMVRWRYDLRLERLLGHSAHRRLKKLSLDGT